MARALHWHGTVRRVGMILLIGLLSLTGIAVAADALVTTEQEQLDGFLSDVTRRRLEARLDGALSYANPSTVKLRLSVSGQVQEFGEGESAALADAVRSALGVFDSAEQDLLQHSVRVSGDRATVTTRLGDAAYEQTVIYDLVRSEQRWLLRSVRTL